ncbi:cytochrome-c oxidase, cbb3-type subunit III [Defluviimonas sp. WL0024]|uniref:Cbb3-type cytochrome c oxidase subunit n=1 Tax=Albidovulum salinarum TaxID=2984153 RepID=A0ABT2X8D1_9RHOB|nr:cytochrome-c oxidase, cbb3-type subunit III [Defluviimonas sp. WL0024]MCU9850206.1 cytochrome-c oxidase, cbb3-type subunit III [Defluviimonas sp. WL0024]
MSRKPIKQKADPETTGHEWDGIQEWDNPMPRWWLWTFYATIIWGIAYTIAYPAWPLVTQATQGIFGQKNRAAVAAEIQRYEDANAPVEAKLVAADLTAIASDPELQNYTMNAGGAVFRTWCAQCHGSGAAGAVGYPNLLDNDWLWGGTIEDIHTTISHGIRNTEDADARYSEMPRFGADELLEPEQIDQVVNHVLKISGQEADEALAAEGATVYADNCAGCHGEDGTGDRAQGAPNLTDAIWLYGGDVEALTESVSNARFGVMPAWAGRLSEAEIRAVAAWVHSRGGGE